MDPARKFQDASTKARGARSLFIRSSLFTIVFIIIAYFEYS